MTGSSNEAPKIVYYLIAMPRWVRIALITTIALATVLLVFPLIDNIYWHYFFTVETRVIPSIVSAGLGGMMYLLGWHWVVGVFKDERPAINRRTTYYLFISMLIILLDILLLAQGIITANQTI